MGLPAQVSSLSPDHGSKMGGPLPRALAVVEVSESRMVNGSDPNAVVSNLNANHVNEFEIFQPLVVPVKFGDYTMAFGNGPRNFEPWSSDVDDT
ncbi:hypothetical protein TNCV_3022251 [Trichonephila clavipes]|nr:hypothetical protein TNCV_3022251 [Trichonephila clavipes]